MSAYVPDRAAASNGITAVRDEVSRRQAVRVRDNTLMVCDDGPGIADKSRDHLFSSFFPTKRDGRGIGLTVVQEILTDHGFAFSLENRAAGGAIFSVQFAAVQ